MLNQFKQLKSFTADPLTFIENERKRKGDFFTLNLGIKKIHFACHPKYAEALLGVNADHFQKSRLIFNKIRPITGKRGLVQLENDEWARMRKITNEIFQRQYMAQYPEMMTQYLDELCDTAWEGKDVARMKRSSFLPGNVGLDIISFFTTYTLKTAINVIFGKVNDADVQFFSTQFIELNACCGLRMRSLINLPSVRIYRIQQKLRAKIAELIATQQQNEASLLSILKQQFNLDNRIEIELIIDQLMTFIFAGFETTAASLVSSLYLIAKHPELQEKIMSDDEKQLYTTAVYKEALRLYPPAWMLAREAVVATSLCDQTIAKGDNIFLSVREIQRHPEVWESPEECMPERFLQEDKPRFAFIPFGMGKRICSGHGLAMMEAVLALPRLCKYYHFSLTDDQPLKMQAMVTLHPVGSVNLQVIKR